jgi:hypothetical protein
MDPSKELMLKSNRHQLVLTILFIVFILFDFKLPGSLANAIDSPIGMTIVIIISLALFCATNPILGFISFVVAYELIRRAGVQSGSQSLKQYVITESQKNREMESFNNDINNNKLYSSLEEEVVTNMVPYINKNTYDGTNVKPVLDKQHDAASIHYKGVI